MINLFKNEFSLIGEIIQHPELKKNKRGDSFCNIFLETQEEYKDTLIKTVHRVITWNSLAKLCFEKFKKEDLVRVKGRIQTKAVLDQYKKSKRIPELVAINVVKLY